MKWDLRRPCDDCPFRKEGGIRLTAGRIHEIAGGMLSPDGTTFACHKTTGVTGSGKRDERHCAGALIFAEKHGTATQMMRIAGRLGVYDPGRLLDHDAVFDDLPSMLRSSIDRRPR